MPAPHRSPRSGRTQSADPLRPRSTSLEKTPEGKVAWTCHQLQKGMPPYYGEWPHFLLTQVICKQGPDMAGPRENRACQVASKSGVNAPFGCGSKRVCAE